MLELKQIYKVFQNGKGVKGVSFTSNQGVILGLLGPNGSGKSTMLKIIAGVTKATSGLCTFSGEETEEIGAKKNIGYLPEEPFLYNNLSPLQFLRFVQAMKNIEGEKEVDEWIELFDLWTFRHQTIGTFSFGMKKKVALISALLGNPKLLVLDEPTNGLDVKSLLILKKIIIQMKKKGSIIIISSHVLDFIEKIVDKVIFIKDGTAVITIENNNNVNLESAYINIYLQGESLDGVCSV